MALHEFLDYKYGVDGDDVLRQMLDEGADPDAAGAGFTALHAAVLRGDLDLVDALVA